jgi:hypothetical protein
LLAEYVAREKAFKYLKIRNKETRERRGIYLVYKFFESPVQSRERLTKERSLLQVYIRQKKIDIGYD